MIFNLFKRKENWQHKDSNIRIAAINEELNINDNADKTILLSLINNDRSELVRRAALLKLKSFDDYYNASKSNDNKGVQHFAEQQVHDILASKHTLVLELAQKQLLVNTLEPSLLNHWLTYEESPELVLSLFNSLTQHKKDQQKKGQKKDPSQLLLQIFSQKQRSEQVNGAIQAMLLTLDLAVLDDEALLTKLNKNAANKKISAQINTKLAIIKEQKEKPKKVLKYLQLLLAKLLALKDLTDYSQYLSKQDTLTQAWQQHLPELTCLADEEQQILINKHDTIIKQLNQLFAVKEETYQQEKIAQQLSKDKVIAKENFSQKIAELNHEIITAVFEDKKLIEEEFLHKLAQLNEQIQASVLNTQAQDKFAQQMANLAQRLTQLPEIAHSVSQATYLISTISQLTLPQNLTELNDRKKTYSEWLTNWQGVDDKACGMLPESIKAAHKEICQTWQAGLKSLQQEQKQLFTQTKKKLIDLKRLLSNGKYKVCFGLFKGVKQAIEFLSPQQLQQLQRDFDDVSEKMAEVSDWEHYIATPRKQELLTEITALVTSPLDNPNDQAEKVKQFRKKWNSFGHADEVLDHDLNEQFNLACEQAFAPCRMYYAEQEKLREQHHIVRNNIIEQAKQLADATDVSNADSIDFKLLDGQLTKLQHRWQQAGEVDRQLYQKLFKLFKNTIQGLKQLIQNFYETNALSKQALINKAKQQLAVDDVYQAIETIKKLQQEWRNIGFAGSHQESQLWKIFRAVNDEIFAKRKQVKTEQQAVQTNKIAEFELCLGNIKAEIIDEDKNSLVNAKSQAEQLLAQVITEKPVLKVSIYAIESLIKQLDNQLSALVIMEEKRSWQSLFALLNLIAQDEALTNKAALTQLTEFSQLDSFWQKRVQALCKLTSIADVTARTEKTLALEILAKVESPAEFSSQRMVVQVQLMQGQMLSGNTVDLSQLLVEWLQLGKLTKTDVSLINRLSPIFNN